MRISVYLLALVVLISGCATLDPLLKPTSTDIDQLSDEELLRYSYNIDATIRNYEMQIQDNNNAMRFQNPANGGSGINPFMLFGNINNQSNLDGLRQRLIDVRMELDRRQRQPKAEPKADSRANLDYNVFSEASPKEAKQIIPRIPAEQKTKIADLNYILSGLNGKKLQEVEAIFGKPVREITMIDKGSVTREYSVEGKVVQIYFKKDIVQGTSI